VAKLSLNFRHTMSNLLVLPYPMHAWTYATKNMLIYLKFKFNKQSWVFICSLATLAGLQAERRGAEI
jgi:hypothetical protein